MGAKWPKIVFGTFNLLEPWFNHLEPSDVLMPQTNLFSDNQKEA